MKFKNIFLVLIVLLIILYLGGQIKSGKYDKGHVIALLVLLIFSLIGHFLLKLTGSKAGKTIPLPIKIILQFLFVYAPMITLFVLMVLSMTGKF